MSSAHSSSTSNRKSLNKSKSHSHSLSSSQPPPNWRARALSPAIVSVSTSHVVAAAETPENEGWADAAVKLKEKAAVQEVSDGVDGESPPPSEHDDDRSSIRAPSIASRTWFSSLGRAGTRRPKTTPALFSPPSTSEDTAAASMARRTSSAASVLNNSVSERAEPPTSTLTIPESPPTPSNPTLSNSPDPHAHFRVQVQPPTPPSAPREPPIFNALPASATSPPNPLSPSPPSALSPSPRSRKGSSPTPAARRAIPANSPRRAWFSSSPRASPGGSPVKPSKLREAVVSADEVASELSDGAEASVDNVSPQQPSAPLVESPVSATNPVEPATVPSTNTTASTMPIPSSRSWFSSSTRASPVGSPAQPSKVRKPSSVHAADKSLNGNAGDKPSNGNADKPSNGNADVKETSDAQANTPAPAESSATTEPPTELTKPSTSPGEASTATSIRPDTTAVPASESYFSLSIPFIGRIYAPPPPAPSSASSTVPANSTDASAIDAMESAKEVTKTHDEAATAADKPVDAPAGANDGKTDTATDNTKPDEDKDKAATDNDKAVSPTDDSKAVAPTASSSTWWDYVGWTSPPTASSAQMASFSAANGEGVAAASGEADAKSGSSEAKADGTEAGGGMSTSAAMGDLHGAADSGAAAVAESQSEPVSSLKAGKAGEADKAGKTVETAGKATSVHSQTADAWYAPWTWYGMASPAMSSASLKEAESQDAKLTESRDAKGASGASADGAAAATGPLKQTPSERVKEEALARGDANRGTAEGEAKERQVKDGQAKDGQVKAGQVKEGETAEVTERTVARNLNPNAMSSWTSFFSSGALSVRNKPAEMEVMEVPDDVGENGEKVVVSEQAKAEKDDKTVKDDKTTKDDKKQDKDKRKPDALPLTNSPSAKRETEKANRERLLSASSTTSSTRPGTPKKPPPPPNLVLPTWGDTFHSAPRSLVPPPASAPAAGKLQGAMRLVSGMLFEGSAKGKGKAREGEWDREREREFRAFGQDLPKALDVVGGGEDVLHGAKRVVVIGIHGWFPGAMMRTVLGEPTGTSAKFVSMMVQALEEFQSKHDVKFDKITTMPLEGEGTIERRVDKLYTNLKANEEWVDDLHAADVIFVATHSQGSIVSTHLLDRLIREGHIRTVRAPGLAMEDPAAALGPQRICCLALCGIHLGPLRYLSTSSVLQPYIQYFESTAARELFEFQDTESKVSQAYVKALRNVVNHGTKMVYVASLNDQVVPIYSGLFTSATHPLILRALYIDGDAYHSSDFLSNLLVLLLRVLNSGLSDSGLLAHLSEATAGSLNGVGHSTAYEEIATYSLAVNYLFLVNDGAREHPDLEIEPFNGTHERNDYEIPWALRDLIADARVTHFFADEIVQLRDAFRDWQPKTAILRDIKRKLQPIQRLPSSLKKTGPPSSVSKL